MVIAFGRFPSDAMSRFSGTKDLEIELMPDHSVRITARFKTAYEAAIAYEELSGRARTGSLKLSMRLGEVLEER